MYVYVYIYIYNTHIYIHICTFCLSDSYLYVPCFVSPGRDILLGTSGATRRCERKEAKEISFGGRLLLDDF